MAPIISNKNIENAIHSYERDLAEEAEFHAMTDRINDARAVPLSEYANDFIDEITNKKGKTMTDTDKYETCVSCGKLTDIEKSTPVDLRYGYVEGGGQLCRDCWNELYGKRN